MIARPEQQTRRLTERWTPMFHHGEQTRLWNSEARFAVVVAGRRSGKTEKGKRKIVKAALASRRPRARFVIGCPTREQVKRLYWQDIKDLIPGRFIRRIQETALRIDLITGTHIQLIGFDKFMRSEGDYIDGVLLDEYGDMREQVWPLSVRPMLGTLGRPGWAWIIGKPRGRNHYWQLWKDARKARKRQDGWDRFHWSAEEILPEHEIESLKSDLDELSYEQEVRANFVNFGGRAYYCFMEGQNCVEPVKEAYDPWKPLDLCFDFNVEPGTCAVAQEIDYLWCCDKYGWEVREQVDIQNPVDAWMGEVWIPRNSNTRRVTRKVIQDWGAHPGPVRLFGDPTGGNRHSSQGDDGTDWDIIEKMLRDGGVEGLEWFEGFGDRLEMNVQRKGTGEGARVRSMNTRFQTTDGKVHSLIDPFACEHVIDDCDGTMFLEGGTGEIDKDRKKYKWVTHLTDAMGYRNAVLHPVLEKSAEVMRVY